MEALEGGVLLLVVRAEDRDETLRFRLSLKDGDSRRCLCLADDLDRSTSGARELILLVRE